MIKPIICEGINQENLIELNIDFMTYDCMNFHINKEMSTPKEDYIDYMTAHFSFITDDGKIGCLNMCSITEDQSEYDAFKDQISEVPIISDLSDMVLFNVSLIYTIISENNKRYYIIAATADKKKVYKLNINFYHAALISYISTELMMGVGIDLNDLEDIYSLVPYSNDYDYIDLDFMGDPSIASITNIFCLDKNSYGVAVKIDLKKYKGISNIDTIKDYLTLMIGVDTTKKNIKKEYLGLINAITDEEIDKLIEDNGESSEFRLLKDTILMNLMTKSGKSLLRVFCKGISFEDKPNLVLVSFGIGDGLDRLVSCIRNAILIKP